jgi:hypothetical protein
MVISYSFFSRPCESHVPSFLSIHSPMFLSDEDVRNFCLVHETTPRTKAIQSFLPEEPETTQPMPQESAETTIPSEALTCSTAPMFCYDKTVSFVCEQVPFSSFPFPLQQHTRSVQLKLIILQYKSVTHICK